MQTVRPIRAIVGRDDLRGVQSLGQLVDLLLATDANALPACLHDVSCIEVHFLRFQVEVAAKVVVNLLHLLCPIRVTRIGFALMHQDSFDNAVLLSLFRQRNQPFVGIVIVCLEDSLHPTWSFVLEVIAHLVLHEALDLDASHSHMNDANLNVVGQRSHQSTAEPIGRSQSGIGSAEWRNCLAPFAHLATPLSVVHSRHQHESRSWTFQVLSLWLGGSLHVRLSEA